MSSSPAASPALPRALTRALRSSRAHFTAHARAPRRRSTSGVRALSPSRMSSDESGSDSDGEADIAAPVASCAGTDASAAESTVLSKRPALPMARSMDTVTTVPFPSTVGELGGTLQTQPAQHGPSLPPPNVPAAASAVVSAAAGTSMGTGSTFRGSSGPGHGWKRPLSPIPVDLVGAASSSGAAPATAEAGDASTATGAPAINASPLCLVGGSSRSSSLRRRRGSTLSSSSSTSSGSMSSGGGLGGPDGRGLGPFRTPPRSRASSIATADSPERSSQLLGGRQHADDSGLAGGGCGSDCSSSCDDHGDGQGQKQELEGHRDGVWAAAAATADEYADEIEFLMRTAVTVQDDEVPSYIS